MTTEYEIPEELALHFMEMCIGKYNGHMSAIEHNPVIVSIVDTVIKGSRSRQDFGDFLISTGNTLKKCKPGGCGSLDIPKDKNIEQIKAHLRCIEKWSIKALGELPIGDVTLPTPLRDLISDIKDDIPYYLDELTRLSSPKA